MTPIVSALERATLRSQAAAGCATPEDITRLCDTLDQQDTLLENAMRQVETVVAQTHQFVSVAAFKLGGKLAISRDDLARIAGGELERFQYDHGGVVFTFRPKSGLILPGSFT